ncbi:hypothetical protein QM583_22210 [Gordonia alkanivorans]|uniref:hypothetical protein n=1 Tax=Gordonia alkanivorans TaxID=84096 RepID=UPI0024B772DC|nr:hypothetical protein [Gordonia alkanivorans]MDJ0029759.1 hypothetical protein [Gordonia alkanivorans]
MANHFIPVVRYSTCRYALTGGCDLPLSTVQIPIVAARLFLAPMRSERFVHIHRADGDDRIIDSLVFGRDELPASRTPLVGDAHTGYQLYGEPLIRRSTELKWWACRRRS